MPSIATKKEPLTRIKVISGTKKIFLLNSHRRSTIISKPTGYYRPVGYICKSFVFTFNLDIMKKNYPLLSICLLALPFQGYAQKKANETKPNILFICVDDLRRELGAYGSVVKPRTSTGWHHKAVYFSNIMYKSRQAERHELAC